MEKLNADFAEFAELLERRGVKFLVVGGYSVAVHGFPRYTGDIDFFVERTEENAERLVQVFEDFGFGELDLMREDFLEPDSVVEIGREPRKIQVLTGIDGVSFNVAWEGRISRDIGGLKLNFIGKKELVDNKRAVGRPKDLIDLLELEKD